MTLQFIMKATLTVGPGGFVYWAVLGTPDYTGEQSGYNPADLTGIAIDYSFQVPINGEGGITPTGLVGGDLGGTLPNPVVTQIQDRPVSITAPTTGQALVYNGSSYVPAYPGTTFNVKNYGATGNGSTDDTTAIQSAISAFQTAAATGSAVKLYFPAGTYLVSAPLTVTNVTGCTITGDGHSQTTIKEITSGTGLAGQLGILVLTNCRYLIVEKLNCTSANHYASLASPVSSGSSSITIGATTGGTPTVGMRVAIVNTNSTLCDVLTIQSIVGSTITFHSPLINSYTTSAIFCFGVFACINIYSNQSISGAQLSTDNHFQDITCGSSSNYSCLFGMGSTCVGGPPVQLTVSASIGQSTFTVKDSGLFYVGQPIQFFDAWYSGITDTGTVTSINQSTNAVTIGTTLTNNHSVGSFVGNYNDSNNDQIIMIGCLINNAVVGAYIFEGQNALGNRVSKSDMQGTTYAAVWMQNGGSAMVTDSIIQINGWDCVTGGLVQHPSIFSHCLCEGIAGLVYSDPSWNTQNCMVKFNNYDKKVFSASPQNPMVNATSSGINLFVDQSNIDGTGSWSLTNASRYDATSVSTVVCTGGRSQLSSLSLNGVQFYNYGMVTNSFSQALSGGASVHVFGDDGYGNLLLGTDNNVVIQINGTDVISMGQNSSLPGNNIIWLQSAASTTNYALAANATNTTINAPSSGGFIEMAHNGTLLLEVGSNQALWNNNAVGPVYSILAPSSDLATTAIIIEGQSAYSGAVTHTNGGDIQLIGGINASGGTVGYVDLHNTPTAGSASPGSATLPANPVGFIEIKIGGAIYKLPYYNT